MAEVEAEEQRRGLPAALDLELQYVILRFLRYFCCLVGLQHFDIQIPMYRCEDVPEKMRTYCMQLEITGVCVSGQQSD